MLFGGRHHGTMQNTLIWEFIFLRVTQSISVFIVFI